MECTEGQEINPPATAHQAAHNPTAAGAA
jgi:hypothetical protein